MKLGRKNAGIVQRLPKLLQLELVLDCQMYVGRVSIDWTSKGVSMFKGGVTSLNCLLREGDDSRRDGVEVCFGNLKLSHDASFQSWFHFRQGTLA